MVFTKALALGIFFLSSVSGAHAATVQAHAPASLPPLMREVEDKYAHALTLTANFQETTDSAALKTTKKSSGIISFKRPEKVRWETTEPDKNLLVGDGVHFWYYTPPFDPGDNGQYSERPASKVQSRFAQVLLSASFSSNAALHSMKVVSVSTTQFELIPKKGSAGTVKQATVTIDADKKLITAVELKHVDGNRTLITLTHIELGKPLDDQRFRFTPPAHTDKID